MTVEAVNLIAATITGGNITGVVMEGSTIYAGDRKEGTYIAITNAGAIYGYKNNNMIYRYETGNSEGRIELGSAEDTTKKLTLDSVFDVVISGSNTGKASRIWTGCNRLLIGGDKAYELRIELNGTRIMTIEDTGVTINGDLHVTGTTS